MRVILASASPRRAELLAQLVPQIDIHPSAVNEQQQASESAQAYVCRLAQDKANAVAANVQDTALIVGSDTLIDAAGKVLEKPRDEAHFYDMLNLLSDNTHKVRTGVAVAMVKQGKLLQTPVIEVVTEVTMAPISPSQQQAYWATGEPQDKAGGYAIQGYAGRFIKTINGSYTAVVGLPLYQTEQLLNQCRQRLGVGQ